MNLGMLYIQLEQPDEALFYSKKALDQTRLIGEEAELGQVYLNMGLAYNLKHDFAQAETYTRQAETIFRRYGNTAGLTDAQENWGVIYLTQQHWSEAIVYLQAALTNWRALKHKHDELFTLIYLAEAEWHSGNPKRAHLWLKEAEKQLKRYPQAGRYLRLLDRLNKIRSKLNEATPS
jgi:tetratricopeptide (TPR) repeat protein